MIATCTTRVPEPEPTRATVYVSSVTSRTSAVAPVAPMAWTKIWGTVRAPWRLVTTGPLTVSVTESGRRAGTARSKFDRARLSRSRVEFGGSSGDGPSGVKSTKEAS